VIDGPPEGFIRREGAAHLLKKKKKRSRNSVRRRVRTYRRKAVKASPARWGGVLCHSFHKDEGAEGFETARQGRPSLRTTNPRNRREPPRKRKKAIQILETFRLSKSFLGREKEGLKKEGGGGSISLNPTNGESPKRKKKKKWESPGASIPHQEAYSHRYCRGGGRRRNELYKRPVVLREGAGRRNAGVSRKQGTGTEKNATGGVPVGTDACGKRRANDTSEQRKA